MDFHHSLIFKIFSFLCSLSSSSVFLHPYLYLRFDYILIADCHANQSPSAIHLLFVPVWVLRVCARRRSTQWLYRCTYLAKSQSRAWVTTAQLDVVDIFYWMISNWLWAIKIKRKRKRKTRNKLHNDVHENRNWAMRASVSFFCKSNFLFFFLNTLSCWHKPHSHDYWLNAKICQTPSSIYPSVFYCPVFNVGLDKRRYISSQF